MRKLVLATILAGAFILYPSKLGLDSYADELPVIQQEIVQAETATPSDLRLELPFKAASNWVSDNFNLPGMVWQVGEQKIKFAIQDGKFVASDPADTWFVYGWFGPIRAIKEAYNIKYPQWQDRHNGIDFAGKMGLEVVSASEGKVIFAGNYYGKTVKIAVGDYIITYGHLLDMSVKVGDLVTAGEPIGYLGATGTTNPHLHFEVDKIKAGQRWAINPVPLIDTDWSEVIIPDMKANQFLNDKNPFEQIDFEW